MIIPFFIFRAARWSLLLLAAASFAFFGKGVTVQSQPQLYLPLVLGDPFIYRSNNLADYSVFAECNPGGTSSCPCSDQDAAIHSFDTYGEVVSNPSVKQTYVNAIGFRKFIESYPGDHAISLGTVKYSGEISLPVLPSPDISQQTNPQGVHLMVQLWDGRNALLPANKNSREAAIYWDLNPWVDQEYGKIKFYTKSLELTDTGIKVIPDQNRWYQFELVVDLAAQRYVSIAVDGLKKDLSSYDLATVHHPDWGPEVAVSLTAESMASWPGESCNHVFTWFTHFRNMEFSQIK